MQPEAVTPRFIATQHRRGCRQTKASFGQGDFLEHTRLGARGNAPFAWLLTMARGETEFPGIYPTINLWTQM